MERESGFSLIELLIVIAIILIIAAIAIPNILRARISANEASAAASVRTIVTAEVSYNTAYPSIGYSTLATLGGPAVACIPAPATACIVDTVLAGGTKSGYTFAATGANPVNGANTQYLATGVPGNLSVTGIKAFCATEDNVTRFITPSGGPATRAVCLGATYSPIAQ
jgi:type IV pilus assembly protein PilA